MRQLDTGLTGIVSLAFSGNGRLLAVAGVRNELTVWDWVAGERVLLIPGCNLAYQFAFSPDARWLAAFTTHLTVHSTDGQTTAAPLQESVSGIVVEAEDGRPVIIPPTTTPGFPYSGGVAFTPDGKSLLASRYLSAAQHSKAAGRVDRWTVPSFVPQPGFEPVLAYNRLAIDGSGEYLAGINLGYFELRYARSGGYHAQKPRQVSRGGSRMHLAFAPERGLIAFGWDSELLVMDTEAGKVAKSLNEPKQPHRDAAFTTDGRRLATVSDDSFVTLRDTRTWEIVVQYDWQSGPLRCIAFSPDGSCGVCGTADGKLVFFDVDG
jgi:WD40 repeat protein